MDDDAIASDLVLSPPPSVKPFSPGGSSDLQ